MDEAAKSLQDLLGQKVTAVLAGVSDARAVGDWACSARKPHSKAEERLRHANQVAKLLAEVESRETVRAWFIGMNPNLDDHPPVLMIADARRTGRALIPRARLVPPQIRDVETAALLYRIGRCPDPLAGPPPRVAADNNRFDDPQNEFRVLYAAEQRLVCYIVTDACFRASMEWFAAVATLRAGSLGVDELPTGQIPGDWRQVSDKLLSACFRSTIARSTLTRNSFSAAARTCAYAVGACGRGLGPE